MAISWQIPRNCLAWVLSAQLLLLLPHALRLPWWVIGTYLACALWRIQIYQGRWSLPPKYLKVILAALCFFGIYQSYGTFIGLEPTVALLFSGFSLKLLEVSARRDVYLLIFLGYFVAAMGFLFSQELWLALYLFMCLLVLTAALVALHQHSLDQLSRVSLKKATTIFLQAIPMMVVVFLVFPRMGPLWTVPMPSSKAKTGMSETLSPGDVSDLGLSDELVFRVVFEQTPPNRSQLYWRGLILSGFDGRAWSQRVFAVKPLSDGDARQLRDSFTSPLAYQVIQEPTQQQWLFTLATAYSADDRFSLTTDYRLVSQRPIRSRIQFQVESDLDAAKSGVAEQDMLQFFTRLSGNNNALSRGLASQLRAESASDWDYLQRVLAKFAQENFVYTLKPPLLGDDPVDEFLFTTRRGFCEHYASSFTFLMRAAGIPARVVVGYQGGDFNAINNTLTVRQYDTHAWSEVWFQDSGWVRVDPTAAVSPERIEFGLEQALAANQEEFLSDSPLSPYRYRHIDWINQLRLQLEAMNYKWTVWVLNYEGQVQVDVLRSLLGEVTPTRIAIMVLMTGLIVFALMAWNMLQGARHLAPEQRMYLGMCKALQGIGLRRNPSEGPIDFAVRITADDPGWKHYVLGATRAYVDLSFAPLPDDQRQLVLKQLKSDVRKLRYHLKLR